MLRKPIHKSESLIKCKYMEKCKDYMSKKCKHCDNNLNIPTSYYKETDMHMLKTAFIEFAIFAIVFSILLTSCHIGV